MQTIAAEDIAEEVSRALIDASCDVTSDKIRAYERALQKEYDPNAQWVIQQILENYKAAAESRVPLCDDTGIPHLFLEVGPSYSISSDLEHAIMTGISKGLSLLPGRPMAVKGNSLERLSQEMGLYTEPEKVLPAPMAIRFVRENTIRLSILMCGGGPAIRGKSYRIFHKHSIQNVEDEIVKWALDSCKELGCTPATLAIGVGRSHYEAANYMLEAQVYGSYDHQNSFEKSITEKVNEYGCGPLGLGGGTTVLGTFSKIGPARASGVRIVCLRPCCCFEPRIARVDLSKSIIVK